MLTLVVAGFWEVIGDECRLGSCCMRVASAHLGALAQSGASARFLAAQLRTCSRQATRGPKLEGCVDYGLLMSSVVAGTSVVLQEN